VNLRNQRRLASKLLGVGQSRIWISNDAKVEDFIEGAITRRDVMRSIHYGNIQVVPLRGNSRGRWRYAAQQRARRKRRGSGSRKGTATAREPRKALWIRTIRPLRERLRELRDEGRLERSSYRIFYRRAKGGMFKSRAHLDQALRASGVLKAGKPAKETRPASPPKAMKAAVPAKGARPATGKATKAPAAAREGKPAAPPKEPKPTAPAKDTAPAAPKEVK